MKRVNKIVSGFTIMFIIVLISCTNVFADPNSSKGFLTYSDEQAEKETEELIQAQETNNSVTEIKSTNNYLKSLSVNGYKITPEFDKQTINYEIEQEITEDYIEIEAETDDENSSVSGVGKVTLDSEENNLRIEVTAQNGSVRTYFIKAKKITKKDTIVDKINANKEEVVQIKEKIKKIDDRTIISIVAVIIILALIIICSKKIKKRKSNKHKRKH